MKIQKLDEDGNPVDSWQEFDDAAVKFREAVKEAFTPVLIKIADMVQSVTMVLKANPELMRLLGFKTTLHERRRKRHAAKIVVVHKRRYKHGRKGVFK